MGRDHWVVRLLAEPRISPFVGLLFVRGVNQRYRPVPTCEQFEAPLELHEYAARHHVSPRHKML